MARFLNPEIKFKACYFLSKYFPNKKKQNIISVSSNDEFKKEFFVHQLALT